MSLVKKIKKVFGTVFSRLFSPLISPWLMFRAKFPVASFVVGRLVTMVFILFMLGWALFALMALAPGDIVDQMVQQ